jgi:hypothetical protein
VGEGQGEGKSGEKMKKDSGKQDDLMRAWVQFPERWKQLWDTCEQGKGRYTRGVFILNGKGAQPPTLPPPKKTQGQIIAEMLKSEPMGYLS